MDRTSRTRVAILGSTGSIGESALRVIGRHSDRFEVTVLTAHRSAATLARQVAEVRPAHVVLTDGDGATGIPPEWGRGREALIEAVARPDVDVVINALVGFAGLEPSLVALQAGKRLALANKESLVAAGDLVLQALAEGGGELVPIDSEHSAILQCISGAAPDSVARIVLTASGGAFRSWDRERLAGATPADALNHPTWAMGAKITVDSATLANKALEVIEAHALYRISYDQIGVVIHPQSIVHSFVEFHDGSVLAQLGFPTMELPILYALTHPARAGDRDLCTFDPVKCSPLTFEEPDGERFPLLGIGIEAGRRGGTAPTAFNAANEVAVAAFLAGEIPFPSIAEIVGRVVNEGGASAVRELEDVLDADREARSAAQSLVQRISGMTGSGSKR